MKTWLFTHMDCLLHDTGDGHPERPDRLRAIIHALDEEAFPDLERREAPLARADQVQLVHPKSYVDQILAAIPERGLVGLDADTIASPGSRNAALRAAGAVCAAIDAVVTGEARNAFCAVRPPGHHAEPNRPMGFCLFNNIAIGARHAVKAHGLARIAIVDFDVHHGNGTQAAFENAPEVLFVSSHQSPLYPGTGRPNERGVGNILNLCLPPGAGSAEFRSAFETETRPALADFQPDLIMISAGFDADARDPLANLNLTEEDFGWITAELVRFAENACGGRIVSVLEGGYDLEALGAGAAAHIRALSASPA